MNIEILEKNISNLKYPIIFLFRLMSYIDDNIISDDNLYIILKLFFKYHIDILLYYDITKILNLNNYLKSKILFIELLIIIKEKYIIIIIFKNIYKNYNNDIFWDMDLDNQIDYLNHIKNIFLAVFDTTYNNIPFYYKLYGLLYDTNPSKYEIMKSIEDRLLKLLEIFKLELFNYLDIPIISVNYFYSLSEENIIKYLSTIYLKFNNFLNNIINLFINYNIICIKLLDIFN